MAMDTECFNDLRRDTFDKRLCRNVFIVVSMNSVEWITNDDMSTARPIFSHCFPHLLSSTLALCHTGLLNIERTNAPRQKAMKK